MHCVKGGHGVEPSLHFVLQQNFITPLGGHMAASILATCHLLIGLNPNAWTNRSSPAQWNILRIFLLPPTLYRCLVNIPIRDLPKFYLFDKVNISRFWEHMVSVSHETSCIKFRMTKTMWLFKFHTILTTFIFGQILSFWSLFPTKKLLVSKILLSIVQHLKVLFLHFSKLDLINICISLNCTCLGSISS